MTAKTKKFRVLANSTGHWEVYKPTGGHVGTWTFLRDALGAIDGHEAEIGRRNLDGTVTPVSDEDIRDDERAQEAEYEIAAENAWLKAAEYDERMLDPREW